MDPEDRSVERSVCIWVAITLTIIACLFPPLQFMGVRSWGFIFGAAGFGMTNVRFLDPAMLFFEAVIICGLVAGFYRLNQTISVNLLSLGLVFFISGAGLSFIHGPFGLIIMIAGVACVAVLLCWAGIRALKKLYTFLLSLRRG